jgi:membrane-associated protein
MFSFSALQVDSLLSYLLAFGIPALDAVFPVLPGETVIVALGVATAGSVDPRIALLVATAAAGAFVGDNLCYFIGERFSPWVNRRFFATEKALHRRQWAERALDRRGALIILVCRFIPGGRTAVTLTCGVTHFRRRTFLWATAVSAVIWATYAFFIGRLGGSLFRDKEWLSLLVALGIILVLTGIVEVGRRLFSWLKARRARAEDSSPAAPEQSG